MPSSRRAWPSFLKVVDKGEQVVAKVLTVVTAVVIVAALGQLIMRVAMDLISPQPANWLGDGLVKALGSRAGPIRRLQQGVERALA